MTALFKSLRKRLFSFSKEVEDEIEKELGDVVEKELARSVEKATPPKAPPAAHHGSHAAGPVPSPPAPMPPAAPKPFAPVPSTSKPLAPGISRPAAPASTPRPGEALPRPVPAAPPPPAPAGRPKAGPVRKPTREELAASVEKQLAAELAEAVEAQKEVEAVLADRSGGGIRISEKKLDDLLWDLEVGLLESDVALPVVEAIKTSVREQLLAAEIGRRDAHDLVYEVLRTAIKRVLAAKPFDFDAYVAKAPKPLVIMFVGVNGTGKTTSIAKIAHRLKNQGLSSVMAAGDTFRAGAIEQLTQHADRLGVKIVKHSAGSDPAAVAYDAIEHAKARAKDVVLLDTAGRMQTNTNLMEEMAKIKRVAKPHLILFVGDSLAGNDAVEQAARFNDVVGIDGVILTKVDADAKGGAALSVAHTIGKPLVFVGLGQGYDDQVPFDPDWMVDRLFGTEEREVEA